MAVAVIGPIDGAVVSNATVGSATITSCPRLSRWRHPLALRTGFQEDPRGRPPSQYRREAFPRRRDAALLNGSIFLADAELTLALVQIEPYRIHGGWSPGVCLVLGR